MNELARAAKYLAEKLPEHGGETVEYVRPGLGSFKIQAVPGQLVTEQETEEGFVLRTSTRDFVVDRVDLARGLLGSDPLPVQNDEIRQTVETGEVFVFLVNGDGFATAHYEPADPYGHALRIHTRQHRIVARES